MGYLFMKRTLLFSLIFLIAGNLAITNTAQAFSPKAVATGVIALTGPLIYGLTRLSPRKKIAFATGLISLVIGGASLLMADRSSELWLRENADGYGFGLGAVTFGYLSCVWAEMAIEDLRG